MVQSKKKTFKLAILFLVLAVFLVSGQEGCPSTGFGKDAPLKSAGLEVSFVEEAPPSTVSVNQEFPLYVNLLNKGGDFINKGDAQIYLSGIGPNLENVHSKQSNSQSLAKDSLISDRINFAEKARFTFPIESLHTLPLSLTTCYAYGTRTQASICISNTNQTELCKVGTNKITSSSNSIAPIQITELKETVIGNKLTVLFKIENNLGGAVYLPDTDCDKIVSKNTPLEAFKQNKVRIEVRTTESGFICKLQNEQSPYGPVDATIGTIAIGTVVCEKALEEKSTRQSPFSVVLRYKYVDSSLKTINIVP